MFCELDWSTLIVCSLSSLYKPSLIKLKVINAKELAVKTVELMEQFKITGFLCVDNDSKLVGAFNLHDLFRAKLL